jgi:hypothetical protein
MRSTLTTLPADYRMTCNVYRPDYDCTLSGLSSQHDHVLLVGEGYKPGSSPADRPAFFLRERGGAVHAYPADVPEGAKGFSAWQFGGNFIYCSDSRFPNQYPIPVHDRRERLSE